MKFLPELHIHKIAGLLIIGLLLNACTTKSGAPAETPVISTIAAPLAEKDIPLYTNAIAALTAGNAKEAAASLTRVTKKNPGYLDAWVNLAIAEYSLKHINEAKRAIGQAHMLQSESADISNIQALICIDDGRYKEAEQHYLNALKLDANNANVHYNLALLYDLYYQDIAKAIPHYEHYLSLLNQKDEKTEAWTEELKDTLSRRN